MTPIVLVAVALALGACSSSQDERTREQARQTAEKARRDAQIAAHEVKTDAEQASRELDKDLQNARRKVRGALDQPADRRADQPPPPDRR